MLVDMRGRGGVQGDLRLIALGLVIAVVGACSSEMDPNAPPTPPSTSTTAMDDSLSNLGSLVGSQSMMIIATNASALVRGPTDDVHFFSNQPGEVAAAAASVHLPVCSVELDALVVPPAPASDVAASLTAARAKCAQEDVTGMLAELHALQTGSTEVIVGANAAETWHSTNNGVNYFYGNDVLAMLHAARQMNVLACVVAPGDISLPMPPTGQTPGVSLADALEGCGLPP
jgi:hypothetical protein